MVQEFSSILIKTGRQGLYEFTSEVQERCSLASVRNGLVNLSISHTSASLLIQENADPAVGVDIQNFFSHLVPRGPQYTHNSEGDDDMPAHIRTVLTNTNLAISVQNFELLLGVWQGLYVFEHRDSVQERTVFCHIIGDLG
tara:strand:- start:770 stop:1192 length:423 start_codon:yes stop_codon:yes gene_type:complete